MKKVTVNASKKYDIVIEKGLLPKVGGLVSQVAGTSHRIAIVTDDNVDPLYGDTLVASLEKSGFSGTEKFVIAHGERSKSPETLLELLSFLAKKHFTRSDLLIALGGGVVGDLRLCRIGLPARRSLCPDPDDTACGGRFFGRRQNRRRSARGKKSYRKLLSAVACGLRPPAP